MKRPTWLALVAFILALVAASSANLACACPICGQPTVTLAERFARADGVMLVEWVSARPAQQGMPDTTTYEVVEIPRAEGGQTRKGDRLTVDGYHSGKPGNLVLLFGRRGEAGKVEWNSPPLDVTETTYQYILQAPSPESRWTKRLEYYVRFLEFPDVDIANDAFAEFVNAPAKDIAATAKLLPRAKVHRWLFDPKTPLTRIAAYGLMLGLCGNATDAQALEQKIFDREDDRRIGLEGIVVGYLLLTGEAGLEKIARDKLRSPGEQTGDVYPCLQALRYVYSYGNGKIATKQIAQAMRILVEQPEFSPSAITDLARWKDWGLQSRLMELYGTEGFDDRHAKQAIIGFLIACIKDVPANTADASPAHVGEAQANLARLRERDPKLVAEIEKFFFFK